MNSQLNSEIEKIFNNYEKTREEINFQIIEIKKFVSESYQSIRELTIQTKTMAELENHNKVQRKGNFLKDFAENEVNSNLKIEEV